MKHIHTPNEKIKNKNTKTYRQNTGNRIDMGRTCISNLDFIYYFIRIASPSNSIDFLNVYTQFAMHIRVVNNSNASVYRIFMTKMCRTYLIAYQVDEKMRK